MLRFVPLRYRFQARPPGGEASGWGTRTSSIPGTRSVVRRVVDATPGTPRSLRHFLTLQVDQTQKTRGFLPRLVALQHPAMPQRQREEPFATVTMASLTPAGKEYALQAACCTTGPHESLGSVRTRFLPRDSISRANERLVYHLNPFHA